MAALPANADPKAKVSLVVSAVDDEGDKTEVTACTLSAASNIFQQSLDLVFTEGETISLSAVGDWYVQFFVIFLG